MQSPPTVSFGDFHIIYSFAEFKRVQLWGHVFVCSCSIYKFLYETFQVNKEVYRVRITKMINGNIALSFMTSILYCDKKHIFPILIGRLILLHSLWNSDEFQ